MNKYKDKIYVDIRTHYLDKDTGVMKPGPKGIALTLDSWKILKQNINNIDNDIRKFKLSDYNL